MCQEHKTIILKWVENYKQLLTIKLNQHEQSKRNENRNRRGS